MLYTSIVPEREIAYHMNPRGRLVFHRTTPGFDLGDLVARQAGIELQCTHAWGPRRDGSW
jgi:hypothetical protein